MTTTRSVAEIEAELKEAKERDAKERIEKAMQVKPIYTFYVIPKEIKGYHKIWDPSILLYAIGGSIQNRKELQAVGKAVNDGEMLYLYNIHTGKIVTPLGGGIIYTEDPILISKIANFIINYPLGGDITHILKHLYE